MWRHVWLLLLLLPLVHGQAFNDNDDNNSSLGANANDVQVIPGLRPGTFRYHIGDGFFFHRQRVASGRVFLRCVLYRGNPPCHVRAVMNTDLSGFTTSNEHNHAPDEQHEMVQGLRSSLLEACRVRPNVRVDLIYHDVCRNVPRDVSSRVSLLSIRPSMIRTQAENRPNIPHSFEGLDELLRNSDELRTTLDSQTNLYQGMTGLFGHRSLLFMSRRILQGAGDIRHLFGDATFYARPNQPQSAQLYTLVTVRDNHILPLAYALMESRTESAYRDLYQFIRRTVPELDPDFFMTDYEVAQQNSILEVFPRVRLSGCLWHYSRAVCRQVRSLGLHQLVRDNVNARRIVRLSLAIPLAPPARVMDALNEVVMESRRLQLQESFANFFQYLRGTWVEGVGEAVLSVFGVRHRTNNLAECHHRNINARLVRRPNIWRFLEMLREMEDIAWRDLGRLEMGQAPSRARRVSSLLNDARIRSCSRQVLNREMDLLHFLGSVSWHLNSTMTDMLREREDEDRPGSPVRGPPRTLHDDVRLAPGNRRRSLPEPEFDVDFVEVQSPAANEPYSSLNSSYLFDSLMEDNENASRPSNRGRRGRRSSGRGGRGSAGRSGADRSRPSGRGAPRNNVIPSPSPSPLPSSNNQSQSLEASQLVLRPEVFSDAEEVDENECQARRRWRECMICNTNVGRYSVLGCGAFPLCGSCLRNWFLNLRHRNCPHCGCAVSGWVRLDI